MEYTFTGTPIANVKGMRGSGRTWQTAGQSKRVRVREVKVFANQNAVGRGSGKVWAKYIKAGVIWAGVVASYADMLNNWRRRNPNPLDGDTTLTPGRRWRQEFVELYGGPESNPTFWNAISPISYVSDVGPIQIHHGSNDADVPISMSDSLAETLKAQNRTYEYYIYKGDNHNLSGNLGLALRRSVAFFDKYVKWNP